MKKKRDRWWNIPENLEMFRGPGRCSWCGKTCKAREPHHIFARGMGGNKPPGDSRINLIALGSSQGFECPCHMKIHSEAIDQELLLAIVGAREGLGRSDVRKILFCLARCTKDTTLEELEEKGLFKWVRGGFGTGANQAGESSIMDRCDYRNMNNSIHF